MSCSRREFNRIMFNALAGFIASGSVLSSAGCAAQRFLRTGRVPERVLADLHVHAMINKWNSTTPLAIQYPAAVLAAEKLFNKTGMDWRKCHEAGIDLLCAAHFNVFDEWLSMPTDPNPYAPANTHRMMDQLEEHLLGTAAPYARLARNSRELRRLLTVPKVSPDYRIAVVHTIEGGHALGGNIEALESFARRGVALITLTHFFNKGIASAANSYPFFPDANSGWPYQGLSEFGRDVIKEMERLGIIVDAIHATAAAVDDILKVTTKPLVASHSSARALGDHPYSLYDEHIQQIAADGGLIGVILDPYLLSNYSTLKLSRSKATLDDVVRTIRYITKLTGTHKHVGIGTDFGGYITGPGDMSRLSQVGRLRSKLLKEFGNEQVVEDILANNVIDFLLVNWKSGV